MRSTLIYLKLKVIRSKDNIFVMDEGRKTPLSEFLEKEDLHEMVRKNVLTITKIFDKRVHKFMSKIVMAPSNPMKTKYYHYFW